MRSRTIKSAVLAAVLSISPAAVPAATTPDNFVVRTAADLAALCSADQNDPMMAAALGFCHGFGVGVYQTLQKTQATMHSKLFCVPTPGPSRTQALAGFVTWVKATPSLAADPPADAILRYLEQTYPCAGGGR